MTTVKISCFDCTSGSVETLPSARLGSAKHGGEL
jgi:hypothetical protein